MTDKTLDPLVYVNQFNNALLGLSDDQFEVLRKEHETLTRSKQKLEVELGGARRQSEELERNAQALKVAYNKTAEQLRKLRADIGERRAREILGEEG